MAFTRKKTAKTLLVDAFRNFDEKKSANSQTIFHPDCLPFDRKLKQELVPVFTLSAKLF
jgi:hypothetical protein